MRQGHCVISEPTLRIETFKDADWDNTRRPTATETLYRNSAIFTPSMQLSIVCKGDHEPLEGNLR
jgi:hypothetical protein